jgi:hypothetical protein
MLKSVRRRRILRTELFLLRTLSEKPLLQIWIATRDYAWTPFLPLIETIRLKALYPFRPRLLACLLPRRPCKYVFLSLKWTVQCRYSLNIAQEHPAASQDVWGTARSSLHEISGLNGVSVDIGKPSANSIASACARSLKPKRLVEGRCSGLKGIERIPNSHPRSMGISSEQLRDSRFSSERYVDDLPWPPENPNILGCEAQTSLHVF